VKYVVKYERMIYTSAGLVLQIKEIELALSSESMAYFHIAFFFVPFGFEKHIQYHMCNTTY